MISFKWTTTSVGVPTESDFSTTGGQGTPLCIDKSTGNAYYYDNGVKPLQGLTNVILPGWFGAKADDDDGVSGTDNSVAFAAMIAYINANSKPGKINPLIYRGGPEILIVGRFYVGAFTIEPLSTISIRGIGGIGWGCPSRLRFAPNVTALHAQAHNTGGGIHFAGDNWTLDSVYFYGPWNAGTTTEGNYHGLHVERPIQVSNCTFDGFQGDGVNVDSTTGLPDMCRFYNTKILNSRNGVFLTGGDSNACTFIACEFNDNRCWGVNDTAFLGNYYWGNHAANNGITNWSATLGASVVSHGGNRYAVIDGQEVGAALNAPSGVATDNTWWYYMSPGGPNGTSIPAWALNMPIRSGGAYRLNNANATSSLIACYSEAGQGPSQIQYPARVDGGALTSGIKGTAAYSYNYQGWFRVGTNTGRGIIVDGNVLFNFPGTGAGLELNDPSTPFLYWEIGNVVKAQQFYVAGTAGLYYDNLSAAGAHFFRIAGADIGQVDGSGIGLQAGKVFKVNGQQVVGARQANIPAPAGGATVDTQARTAINSILTLLQNHGLMA